MKKYLLMVAAIIFSAGAASAQISVTCSGQIPGNLTCLEAISPTAVPTPIPTSTAIGPTSTPTPAGAPTASSAPCTVSPATSAAFASAVASAKAGAVICPAANTFTSPVVFENSGTASAPIVINGQNAATLAISSASAIAINGNGKSYITVENLTVTGGLWGFVNTGGSFNSAIGNTISDAAAGGISLNQGDHQVIENNDVHDNAKTWSGSASGISIWEPKAADNAVGWHNIVSHNASYDNCNPQGGDDGDGIIVDTFTAFNYSLPTLIEENLTWGNCGAGINVTSSSGIVIRNNTNYWNHSKTTNSFTWRGEINLEYDSGNVIANNIDCPNPSFNPNNTAILEGDSTGDILAANIDCTTENPMLANPPLSMELLTGSPAIDAGTTAYGVPATNFAGAPIVGTPDIGAY